MHNFCKENGCSGFMLFCAFVLPMVAVLAEKPQRQQAKSLALHESILMLTSKRDISHFEPYNFRCSTKNDYVASRASLQTKHDGGKNNDAVVEITIVTDTHFSGLFNFDTDAITNYFKVFMWDTALSEHKFIEEAINEANHPDDVMARLLTGFSRWVYDTHSSWKPFDVALLATNAIRYGVGGIANLGGACSLDHKSKRHLSTAVLLGGRAFHVLIGAHEVGHLLGARHDFDTNSAYPCTEKGYIMSGDQDSKTQYFFSTCSEKMIDDFIKSESASCLYRIDNPKSSLTKVVAPSVLDQCKRYLRRTDLFINEAEAAWSEPLNCLKTNCYWKEKGQVHFVPLHPVDNTPCGNSGHCFRGRCVNKGKVLRNVGSQMCIKAFDQFIHEDRVAVTECLSPTASTPLEEFSFKQLSQGAALVTPYSTRDGRIGEKCIWPENYDGGSVNLFDCTSNNRTFWEWEMVGVNKKQFLLRHLNTGRCAGVHGNRLVVHSHCDEEDVLMAFEVLEDSQ